MRIAAIFLIILLSFCGESKGDRVEYKCLKEESHPITTMVCNKACIPIVTISYTCVLKELRIVIDGKIYRPTGLDYIGKEENIEHGD